MAIDMARVDIVTDLFRLLDSDKINRGDVDLSIAAALVEMSNSGRVERLRVGAAAVFLRKPRETLRTGESSMNATVPSISIYAALLALLAAALTVNVILNRVRSGVASGDGGVSGLARAFARTPTSPNRRRSP